MRSSKKRSNVIPFEIGRERYEDFKKAIGHQKSVTEELIEHMDSVILENQKKEEAHVTPINVSFKKGSLDMYIYNSLNNFLKLDNESRMKFLVNLEDLELTKVAISTLELRSQIQYVRNQRKLSR